MEPLTESELRFELRRCLHSLSRSTLRDMLGKPDARERGYTMGVEEILPRFTSRLEVRQIETPTINFSDLNPR